MEKVCQKMDDCLPLIAKNSKLGKAEDKIKELDDLNWELWDKIGELDDSNGELQDKIEELERELLDAKARVVQVDTMYKQQLADKERELERVRGALYDADTKRSEYKQQLADLRKKKETYHADCLRIKQLERELAECKEHNGYVVDKWNELWYEYKQQLARYEEFQLKCVAVNCPYLKEFESEGEK